MSYPSSPGSTKPYLSEFENGRRGLTDSQAERLTGILESGIPLAGREAPEIFDEAGYCQVRFLDDHGEELSLPHRAFLLWEEADGTSCRMYVGQR